jgi:hypothetical protein
MIFANQASTGSNGFWSTEIFQNHLDRSQFAILPKLGRSVCPVPFVTAARHTFA